MVGAACPDSPLSSDSQGRVPWKRGPELWAGDWDHASIWIVKLWVWQVGAHS